MRVMQVSFRNNINFKDSSVARLSRQSQVGRGFTKDSQINDRKNTILYLNSDYTLKFVMLHLHSIEYTALRWVVSGLHTWSDNAL